MAAEHPILFTGPMVRAILDGTKTETRRVMKPALWPIVEESARVNGKPAVEMLDFNLPCPYGLPGGRLWVRETYAWVRMDDTGEDRFVYRATEPDFRFTDGDGAVVLRRDGSEGSAWKPSIFMPRRASRILLEVTDIRVERVQEITGEGAQAEGVSSWWHETVCPLPDNRPAQDHDCGTPVACFACLWDSINAKRGEKTMLVEPWKMWTWAESPEGDPEALDPDIAEPAEIRWRNLADEDEAEWTRFGDSQPSCAGMYEVIWESGDAPRSVYLQKCEEIEGEHHSFQSYAWEADPWVWVVTFKKVEAA